MSPSPEPNEPRAHQPRMWFVQRRVAGALGVSSDDRERVLRGMLEGHSRGAIGYWLQLLLATAIATLGLVLNSTGVVIGAMLISPLMSPIVGLGMGLAVGSSVLTVRAFLRSMASILVVASASALITASLPYHEITAEIAARASPTVLDLLIATCCAIAAAYTTLRPGSETIATAAGTAIGIALVPPLCVTGFGLGTFQWNVASGAALLFVANVSAILLLATCSFLLVGFSSAPVLELEERHLGGRRPTNVFAGWIHAALGSKYGMVLRVAMPVLLVALVYFPLRTAMREVTWHVRVRTAVMTVLRDVPQSRDAVRTLVSVEHFAVRIHLVVLGSPAEAASLKEDVTRRIQAMAGVTPAVEVTAVPDAATLRAAAEAGQQQRPQESEKRTPMLPLKTALEEVLLKRWPREQAGELLRWALDSGAPGAITLECTHLGPSLGAAAEHLLAQDVSAALGAMVRVRDEALPIDPVVAEPSGSAAWIQRLSAVSEQLARVPEVKLCLRQPEEPPAPPGRGKRDSGPDSEALVRAVVDAATSRLGAERVGSAPGDGWAFWASATPCAGLGARDVRQSDAGAGGPAPSSAIPRPPADAAGE